MLELICLTGPLLTILGVMFMLPCASLFGLAKLIEAFVNFLARGRFLACMPDSSS